MKNGIRRASRGHGDPHREAFIWEPGRGPDLASLERMRSAFSLPKAPMGEAWFMGDRRMFPELGWDLNRLSASALQKALEQIASGPPCFGQHEEWTEWYHYLLPRLVHRAQEQYVSSIAEILTTAFFSQHPDGLSTEPYSGFRNDALATLGRSLMAEQCWPEGKLDPHVCLNKPCNKCARRGQWTDASGTLSSSMFFHLKYLTAEEVPIWLRSAFAIESPHWRAQLTVWFIGAFPFLTGAIQQPSEIQGSPDIDWDWSHCLRGNYTGNFSGGQRQSEFLSLENRQMAIQEARLLATSGEYLEWVTSFSCDGELVRDLADLPDRFFDLYAEV